MKTRLLLTLSLLASASAQAGWTSSLFKKFSNTSRLFKSTAIASFGLFGWMKKKYSFAAEKKLSPKEQASYVNSTKPFILTSVQEGDLQDSGANGGFQLYKQKDGWWAGTPWGSSWRPYETPQEAVAAALKSIERRGSDSPERSFLSKHYAALATTIDYDKVIADGKWHHSQWFTHYYIPPFWNEGTWVNHETASPYEHAVAQTSVILKQCAAIRKRTDEWRSSRLKSCDALEKELAKYL